MHFDLWEDQAQVVNIFVFYFSTHLKESTTEGILNSKIQGLDHSKPVSMISYHRSNKMEHRIVEDIKAMLECKDWAVTF